LINKKIENIKIKKEIENKKALEQKLKQEKIDYIKNIDLKTDESITKFVSPEVSFNDKKYIPKDLVSFSGSYIIDTK
jgi:hypothetical protein